MKRKISSIFNGDVFCVHVYVGGHEIALVKSASGKWAGKDEIDIVGKEVKAELKFIAPSYTQWKLSIKIDNKAVLNESGESETPKFSFSKQITIKE